MEKHTLSDILNNVVKVCIIHYVTKHNTFISFFKAKHKYIFKYSLYLGCNIVLCLFYIYIVFFVVILL